MLTVNGGENDGLPNRLLPADKTKKYRKFLTELKVIWEGHSQSAHVIDYICHSFHYICL